VRFVSRQLRIRAMCLMKIKSLMNCADFSLMLRCECGTNNLHIQAFVDTLQSGQGELFGLRDVQVQSARGGRGMV
jgi:hypothetical protein